MSKTALIVDDSRTARLVLQQKLEAHDLRVDNAESAEEALTYLGVNRPDIIFMDHEMPGMDGFEAVSAIKKNPATATIPIMMYTAQEGELYVGQARALGAVGVLPKEVEPVELSKVLESVRVIGEHAERHERREDVAATSGDYPALGNFDGDLGILIQELFDQQRAILRRDLLNSHETIAARVIDEIKSPPPDDRGMTWPGTLLPGHWQATSAVLAVVVVIFATLFWTETRSLEDVRSENSALQTMLDRQQALGTQDVLQAQRQFDSIRQALDSTYVSAIGAIEWAANQSSLYSFDEMPLGDFRLSIMSELSDRLAELDFQGLVRIETHVGSFCMSFSAPGDYVLAAGDQPAVQCEQIGFDANEAYERGLRQSVAFANFINLAGERTDGRIRFEIISLGHSSPLISYPVGVDAVTASEWNEIAASNNRVDVSLYPDRPGPLVE